LGLVTSIEGKDYMVLDFVGNSRPEYDFESNLELLKRALHKKSEDDFPVFVTKLFWKKTKETILDNEKVT
jgi:hypothetical protein